MNGETCLHKEITFTYLRSNAQTSAKANHCLCMLWKGSNLNEVYVGCLNEKDAAIIHICQGEEIVKVLPVWSSDSSRRHKWQGDGSNSYSFLPTSSFAPSSPAERDSSLSSFKYIVIYLPFFLLSTLALCTTISEAEGGKKENKAKSQGLKAGIFQVARRKMLFYDSLLICAVDSWL